jgi:hypothetical protein
MPGHYPRQGRGNILNVACAPEVVEGNIAATQRVLSTLATSPEFKTASRFKSTTNAIAAERSADIKLTRYFALIGIDSRDSAAVADFIGARDVRSAWVSSLESTTGLSPAQADTVARQLQTALRGSLQ